MTILGYHGTTRTIAERIVSEELTFRVSNNDGDWLGKGAYFFQDAPARALAWARRYKATPEEEAAVVVAEITPRASVDFLDVTAFARMASLKREFEAYEQRAGMPSHQGGLKVVGGSARMVVKAGESNPGLISNERDRAFINWCVETLSEVGVSVDVVRAPFLFGQALFSSSFLFDESHVQLAVRNTDIIKPIRVITESSYPI